MADPVVQPLSHTDWLKEQQSRYTHAVKTPAELAAELATMSFEQLRLRAGPPPTVRAEQFVWSTEGCRADDAGGPDHAMFDGRMSAFKKGLDAPPDPLPHNQRDDDGLANKDVNAYKKWFAAWGNKLHQKWLLEHPRAPVAPKPKTTKPKTSTTEPCPPRRVLEEVGENSGW
jgi:hypothetical protein